MSETATVQIPVYRTPEGRHTCAKHEAGKTCYFLTWGYHGQPRIRYRCDWCKEDITEGPDGYLTPCGGCPIKQEVES